MRHDRLRLGVLVFLVSCTPPTEKLEGCRTSADCQGGLLCIDSQCRTPESVVEQQPADLTRTELVIVRNDVPADGVDLTTVTVRLKDLDGNLPLTTTVSLAVSNAAIKIDQASQLSNAEGEATFTLHSREVGEGTLSASWTTPTGTLTKPGAEPLRFTKPQPDPQKSTVTFSRTSAILADGLDFTEASVKLVTTAGGVPYGAVVTLASDSAGIFASSATVDDEGEAKVQLRSRLSGDKLVSVLANEAITLAALTSVKFQIAAYLAANASATITTGPKTADDVDGYEVVVIVPTATGGASREATIVLTIGGTANTITDTASIDEPTSARLFVSSTKAETKTFALTINGIALTVGLPTTVGFVPGPPAAPLSKLTLDGDITSKNIPVNISLTSVDKFGNVRAGDMISLAVGAGAAVSVPTVITDAEGKASATAQAATAGTYQTTATWANDLSDAASFTARNPWSEFPDGNPAINRRDYYDPNDLDHIVSHYAGNPRSTVESRDAGMTLSTLDTLGTAYVYSVAFVSNRTYYLTTSGLYVRDGTGPLQLSPLTLPSVESMDGVYAGGNDVDTVYLATSSCRSGTCNTAGQHGIWSNTVYRHLTGTSGWTAFHFTTLTYSAAPPNTDVLESFSNLLVDDTDSSTFYLAASRIVDDGVTRTTTEVGTYTLGASAEQFVTLFGPPHKSYGIDTTADRAVLTWDGSNVSRVSVGSGTALSFGLNGSSSKFISALGSPAWSLSKTATDMSINTYAVGSGWSTTNTISCWLLGTCDQNQLKAIAADRAIIGTAVVNRTNNTAKLNKLTQIERDMIAPMLNRRTLSRGPTTVALFDGSNWNIAPRPASVTSIVAGFDDHTYFEVMGGKLYQVDAASGVGAEISVDDAAAAITGPSTLVLQLHPNNTRYLSASSGYYANVNGIGWHKFAPTGGTLTNYGVDPKSQHIFTAKSTTQVSQYNGTAWSDVTVTGQAQAVSAFYADQRVNGAMYFVTANNVLFKKPADSDTWASFRALTVASQNHVGGLSFLSSDPNVVRVYAWGYREEAYWADVTTTASAFSSCATGLYTGGGTNSGVGPAFVDPFVQRHVVVSFNDQWIYRGGFFGEGFGGCR